MFSALLPEQMFILYYIYQNICEVRKLPTSIELQEPSKSNNVSNSDSHLDSSRAAMLRTMNWRQDSLSCSALYMVENSSSSAAFFKVTEKSKSSLISHPGESLESDAIMCDNIIYFNRSSSTLCEILIHLVNSWKSDCKSEQHYSLTTPVTFC